jgi:hypothetical protein
VWDLAEESAPAEETAIEVLESSSMALPPIEAPVVVSKQNETMLESNEIRNRFVNDLLEVICSFLSFLFIVECVLNNLSSSTKVERVFEAKTRRFGIKRQPVVDESLCGRIVAHSRPEHNFCAASVQRSSGGHRCTEQR